MKLKQWNININQLATKKNCPAGIALTLENSNSINKFVLENKVYARRAEKPEAYNRGPRSVIRSWELKLIAALQKAKQMLIK